METTSNEILVVSVENRVDSGQSSVLPRAVYFFTAQTAPFLIEVLNKSVMPRCCQESHYYCNESPPASRRCHSLLEAVIDSDKIELLIAFFFLSAGGPISLSV